METHEIYLLSMAFSQRIWDLVDVWSRFSHDTVGKQLVRSADSVSANLKEGRGRYHFKDRNLFNMYSRGSLFETQCWIEKAYTRKLLSKQDYAELCRMHDVLHLEINKMIKNTRIQGM
jgi:four helix bundle protein